MHPPPGRQVRARGCRGWTAAGTQRGTPPDLAVRRRSHCPAELSRSAVRCGLLERLLHRPFRTDPRRCRRLHWLPHVHPVGVSPGLRPGGGRQQRCPRFSALRSFSIRAGAVLWSVLASRSPAAFSSGPSGTPPALRRSGAFRLILRVPPRCCISASRASPRPYLAPHSEAHVKGVSRPRQGLSFEGCGPAPIPCNGNDLVFPEQMPGAAFAGRRHEAVKPGFGGAPEHRWRRSHAEPRRARRTAFHAEGAEGAEVQKRGRRELNQREQAPPPGWGGGAGGMRVPPTGMVLCSGGRSGCRCPPRSSRGRPARGAAPG